MRWAIIATMFLVFSSLIYASPLSGSEAAVSGYASANLSDSYDELIRSLYANGNATRVIGGKLSVPWFGSDNDVRVSNLQSGGNCNKGTISFAGYCLVTDEFSQVGLIVSMGNNQTKMTQFFNAVKVMLSGYGIIPGWRCWVNESTSTIDCRDVDVNGNDDTANDATARIINALYNGANNTLFTNATEKALYKSYADQMVADMYRYEMVHTCYNSTQSTNPICLWPAGGGDAASGGLASGDFGFSGYPQDTAIAFLQAYVQTGNVTYCNAAGNVTLAYLQAAAFNGVTFTVPPGKSFRYGNISGGNSTPRAECTNTCSPDKWDASDAPRAFGWGMVLHYANISNTSNCIPPRMTTYMNAWETRHLLTDLTSVVIQYYANGTASDSSQASYKAQGLQAQAFMYDTNRTRLNTSLRSCLDHWDLTPQTWDYSGAFGVYGQSLCMRPLGVAIGRDSGSWGSLAAGNGSGGGGNESGGGEEEEEEEEGGAAAGCTDGPLIACDTLGGLPQIGSETGAFFGNMAPGAFAFVLLAGLATVIVALAVAATTIARRYAR